MPCALTGITAQCISLPSLKDNGMTIGTIGTAGIVGSGGKTYGQKSM